jgi:hypothetical protein
MVWKSSEANDAWVHPDALPIWNEETAHLSTLDRARNLASSVSPRGSALAKKHRGERPPLGPRPENVATVFEERTRRDCVGAAAVRAVVQAELDEARKLGRRFARAEEVLERE